MTDYSRMSYAELFRIANNDAVANRMSEEEYESLSVELWRKFGSERRIVSPLASEDPLGIPSIRSLLGALRTDPPKETTDSSASMPTARQPSLSRSGD